MRQKRKSRPKRKSIYDNVSPETAVFIDQLLETMPGAKLCITRRCAFTPKPGWGATHHWDQPDPVVTHNILTNDIFFPQGLLDFGPDAFLADVMRINSYFRRTYSPPVEIATPWPWLRY